MSGFILLYLNVMYGNFAGQDFCPRIKDGCIAVTCSWWMDGTCSGHVTVVSRKNVSVGLLYPFFYVQFCSSVPDIPGIWCEVAGMSGQTILIIGKKPNQSHALLHFSLCSPCFPPFWMLALHILPALESHHIFKVMSFELSVLLHVCLPSLCWLFCSGNVF